MGNGYGALLAFKRDGTLIGPFNDDSRIVDPRGLALDQKEGLLFLNSGGDRVSRQELATAKRRSRRASALSRSFG
jgi:hypothetical protein